MIECRNNLFTKLHSQVLQHTLGGLNPIIFIYIDPIIYICGLSIEDYYNVLKYTKMIFQNGELYHIFEKSLQYQNNIYNLNKII